LFALKKSLFLFNLIIKNPNAHFIDIDKAEMGR